jgi:hypothetical protein
LRKSDAGLADPAAFNRTINAVRRIGWVVYVKPPFAGYKQVLAYLGYTHRIAISKLPARRHGWRSRHIPMEGVSHEWQAKRL